MPYIGKPQSADPITVNASNIEDGSIISADISSSLGDTISGSFTTVSSSFSTRVSDVEAGSTSKTLVSSSAQLAADISGSSTAVSTSLASRVTTNETDLTTLKGSGTTQGVGQSNSPTFAGGTVTGDLTVGGTITAQEVHTEFESASILFTSGSTVFGNSSDDIHNMTGSLNISGSFGVNDGNVHIADKMIAGSGSGFSFGDTNHPFTVKSTGNNAGFSVLSSAGGEILRFIQESNDAGKLDIYDGGSLKLRLSSHANENNYINNGGKLGIGTNNPVEMLEVYNATSPAIQLNDGGDYKGIIRLAGNDLEVRGSSGALEFYNGSADGDSSTLTMTINNSQRVMIGATSPAVVGGYYAPKFSVEGDDFKGVMSVIEHQNGISGGIVSIGKSRGTSAGAVTILQTDDITGRLLFSSADGVDFRTISAEIRTVVGDSPGANDVPGHLLFMTNDGSGNDSTERMRIASDGNLTTVTGSAISYQSNASTSAPSATTPVVFTHPSASQVEISDSNDKYKKMYSFAVAKSGQARITWSAKNQSGTYYWSWLISRNNGSGSIDVESPTPMKLSNGNDAKGSFAAGLADGNSNSVHNFRKFDVTVKDIVAGDHIELWMRSSDGSGGQVTGNGQGLFAKDFQILSTTPSIEANAILPGTPKGQGLWEVIDKVALTSDSSILSHPTCFANSIKYSHFKIVVGWIGFENAESLFFRFLADNGSTALSGGNYANIKVQTENDQTALGFETQQNTTHVDLFNQGWTDDSGGVYGEIKIWNISAPIIRRPFNARNKEVNTSRGQNYRAMGRSFLLGYDASSNASYGSQTTDFRWNLDRQPNTADANGYSGFQMFLGSGNILANSYVIICGFRVDDEYTLGLTDI